MPNAPVRRFVEQANQSTFVRDMVFILSGTESQQVKGF
ncbi:hypothetical protein SBC2_82250 (plasmid) [Caballeronia sp. SBC2]|nr:hypothetical protein SBC2_82250 [Caballeronia sp. SBC2]